MKAINKVFIITALSLVSLTSFAQSVTATGSTLDEAHAKIAAKAKEAGAEWVVVEQDMPQSGRTALECARLSIKYLNNLIW